MKINALRITVFAGLLIVVLLGVLLAAAYNYGTFSGGQEILFSRLLAEYDTKFRTISQTSAMLRLELDNLDNELDRLESRTEGVESWLSVIKRRRQLANMDSRYAESYRGSTRRAMLEFPHAESIAAVAAAALVQNAAINRENEAQLRIILPLLTDSRHADLRLSLHILLGDFNNPQKGAVNIPVSDVRHGFAGPNPPLEILINLAMVHLLAGSTQNAAVFVQDALNRFDTPDLTLFAAEYYFDFGDFAHSAELFHRLPGDTALSRQADALWLSEYVDSARAIWTIMGDSNQRALYNRALTAQTQEEEEALLESMIGQDSNDPTHRFGLIRHSRFLDVPSALALLETAVSDESSLNPKDLIDLEIVKRRSDTGEVDRVIADTWNLLVRYPDLEHVYQWGAWYFDLQRRGQESALLLRNAGRNNFSGEWLTFHSAMQHLREGDLDAAEREFAAIALSEKNWSALANLGRVNEARQAPSRALDNYEKAAAALTGTGQEKTLSQIQVRIARCLRILGRPDESRHALEHALELDPHNPNARLELSRL